MNGVWKILFATLVSCITVSPIISYPCSMFLYESQNAEQKKPKILLIGDCHNDEVYVEKKPEKGSFLGRTCVYSRLMHEQIQKWKDNSKNVSVILEAGVKAEWYNTADPNGFLKYMSTEKNSESISFIPADVRENTDSGPMHELINIIEGDWIPEQCTVRDLMTHFEQMYKKLTEHPSFKRFYANSPAFRDEFTKTARVYSNVCHLTQIYKGQTIAQMYNNLKNIGLQKRFGSGCVSLYVDFPDYGMLFELDDILLKDPSQDLIVIAAGSDHIDYLLDCIEAYLPSYVPLFQQEKDADTDLPTPISTDQFKQVLEKASSDFGALETKEWWNQQHQFARRWLHEEGLY